MSNFIVSIIRIIILLAATIFACVGTAIAQLKWQDKYYVYLFKMGYKDSDEWIKMSDIDCDSAKNKFTAAYAFAVTSCVVIGCALICVFFSSFVGSFAQHGPLAGVGLSVAGFLTSLIAWTIVVGQFHSHPCGANQTYDEAQYELAPGAVLLIVTWLLMVVDASLAALAFFGLLPGGATKDTNAVESIEKGV